MAAQEVLQETPPPDVNATSLESTEVVSPLSIKPLSRLTAQAPQPLPAHPSTPSLTPNRTMLLLLKFAHARLPLSPRKEPKSRTTVSNSVEELTSSKLPRKHHLLNQANRAPDQPRNKLPKPPTT